MNCGKFKIFVNLFRKFIKNENEFCEIGPYVGAFDSVKYIRKLAIMFLKTYRNFNKTLYITARLRNAMTFSKYLKTPMPYFEIFGFRKGGGEGGSMTIPLHARFKIFATNAFDARPNFSISMLRTSNLTHGSCKSPS